MGKRLLIVEDDEPVLTFLQKGFEAEDYVVDAVADGLEGQSMVETHAYDLVILDLNLPQVNGMDVLKCLRSHSKSAAVLVLSSRREIEERVSALDQGADDYVPKPFAFSELSARARALLRRTSECSAPRLQVEDLELNRVERTVKRGGRGIDLTPKELALLEYLMHNAGQCVTRAMIIEHVWKLPPDTVSNVVDVYINYLRKKIDEGCEVRLIHTLRGTGYFVSSKPRPV
ncbi:MAG: response regulator transcription factor [Terriglobia bacterium]